MIRQFSLVKPVVLGFLPMATVIGTDGTDGTVGTLGAAAARALLR